MDISITKLIKHTDNRGYLAELLTSDDVKLYGYRFGHLFISTFQGKSSVRGNHYHMKQHEYFLVLDGKMKFVFQDIKTGQRKEMIVRAQAQELVRVRVGPMVSHVCWNISKKARLLSYFAYPYDIHNPETVPLNLSKEYL